MPNSCSSIGSTSGSVRAEATATGHHSGRRRAGAGFAAPATGLAA